MKLRNRLLLLGLGLLMTALLTLALRDFVRESIVVPLLYAFWIARLYVESLPQPFLWTLLIVMALFIAGRSMIETRRPREKVSRIEMERTGRVEQWAERIRLGAHGDYFKRRLARRLGQLALEVLAYRQHQLKPSPAASPGLGESRGGLEKLEAPPEIRAYLQAGLMRHSAGPLAEFAPRLPWGRRASPLDLDPEQTVIYLEGLLRGSKGGSG